MANLERILKRRRAVDEAALDDLRLVVLARLDAVNGGGADHSPAPDLRPIVVRRANGDAPGGAIAHPVVGAEPQTPSKWLLVAPLDDEPADGAASAESPDAHRPSAPVDLLSGPVAKAAPVEGGVDEALVDTDCAVIPADPQLEVRDAADATVSPQSLSDRRPGRAAARDRRRRTSARAGTMLVTSADPVPVEPAACCPYCAVLLRESPQTDDWCPRCRQRMVVRSIGGRVVLLAEAALPFFEAERLNEEAWAQDRDRWLALARGFGPDNDEGPQLAEELISEADVADARTWYLSSADRAFRVAERDRLWEEAARIRYEQAGELARIAGSQDPPSDEVVRLHRDGIAADLQAIGEVARNAEVRGESCCEACRNDDHRVVQIVDELGSPTLPHAGCPDGLCRCRWFLTARDQELLAALLRRQMAADRRSAEPVDEPVRDDALSEIA